MTRSGEGARPSRRTPGEVRSGRPETRYPVGFGGSERRRCVRHGLAVGADGRCVLCRREDAADAEESGRGRARALRSAAWLGLVLVVGIGALLVWHTTHSLPESARRLTVAADTEMEEAASGQGSELQESEPSVVLPPQPRAPPPWERRTAPSDLAGATPPDDAAATTLQRPASPDAAPDAGSESADAPSQAELGAALRATPITLYATNWCPVCTRARAFFKANHLGWREVDVERVAGGWQTVERLAGKRAVPVIVVDGEVLGSGLDQAKVMRAVARSVERRLGVTGIELKPL
jgi:glutaredoxin 3